MFYDNFVKLCIERGENPTSVAINAGVDKSAVTRWSKGAIPRDTTMRKLADYFGVSVDVLKGNDADALDYEANSEQPADDGLEAALEALRNQPGRRALLSATRNMTEAQVLRFADWLDDITGRK